MFLLFQIVPYYSDSFCAISEEKEKRKTDNQWIKIANYYIYIFFVVNEGELRIYSK